MVEVDIPAPERDRPNWATVGAVGAVMLAVGLGLAFWGTDEARSADETPDAPAASPSDIEAPEPADEPAEVEDPGEEPAAEEPPDEEPPDEEPTAEELPVEPAAHEPEEATTPAAVATPGTRISSVVPGQVAYLRCDQASGRRCSRDEAFETQVWAAIAQLPTCASPPSGPGWADVRIDFDGADVPAVGWRDTFAPEVTRLDEDATMACLRPLLTQARQSLGAQRLLVSFRFRVE